MPELHIIDARMLQLIDVLKNAGIIKFKEEFYKTVGVRRQNITEIKSCKRTFTPAQIRAVGVAYNVSADWIMGFTDELFRKVATRNPLPVARFSKN
jgi:hypothetical protein